MGWVLLATTTRRKLDDAGSVPLAHAKAPVISPAKVTLHGPPAASVRAASVRAASDEPPELLEQAHRRKRQASVWFVEFTVAR